MIDGQDIFTKEFVSDCEIFLSRSETDRLRKLGLIIIYMRDRNKFLSTIADPDEKEQANSIINTINEIVNQMNKNTDWAGDFPNSVDSFTSSQYVDRMVDFCRKYKILVLKTRKMLKPCKHQGIMIPKRFEFNVL